jgi:signal transduction histidine kinase/AmiR/NasT family two-component response regulator
LGQNGEQVTILQPSLEGPFDEPATPIAKLATFMVGQKAGYRLHLHGSVLATERGGPTWIRDATGAVTIRDHSDLTLTPGDDVDVAGFVVSGNSAPEIENAEVRRNGAGAPPQPIAITTDEALSGERNAQLVQLDARVLDQLHNGSDRVLVVQTGWQTFAVRSKAPLPSLDIGSIVRLSGICVSSGSTTNSPSFELVLRSPSDLTLLRRAPWLTSDRAYRALGILALLSLVASIWVAILRRRVNRQTRIISQKLVEVEALKERAESGSRAKSEFLANISHEIRTPMNGILGMTELALEQNIEPPLRDTLSMVKTSADSLLSIVNNILDLSKVEAGKLELEPLECCLRDCLEESVCVLAARAHSKGLEMICNLHSQLPELVLTDESRLRQILTNLLGNAIKFTDQGEVELIVYPETIRDDVATIHFAVRDTGIGIATEKQTLIFSAFTQADASTTRLYGGSGLGLSIASQLVNLLGGRIWVESQPGVGSTFHFVAPFKVLASRSANDNPGDDRWAGTEVLIIESNACSAKVLSQLLGTWQINATIANSVKSAEDLVRRRGETFGLVIGESQPKSREFSEIKLVLLVPRGKLPCGDGRNEHNFAGHLAKPILRREVWAVVNGALSNGKYARTEVADSLVDAEPSGHRLQVLVVEDNRINQLVARRLIERNGCEVALAGSGHEAVEALAANAYDVVFMDIQMPEMDGLEVTQQIRRTEQGSGRHQYIVAMTAHAMESDRERCLAAGMDDYLSKPVQPAQLKAILESVGLRAQSARASALT